MLRGVIIARFMGIYKFEICGNIVRVVDDQCYIV
ncbi:MAG: hypothetical protein GXY34_01075 [Syntrophomonadaceae bacterium]|nr:hypothetical protein [Syntrophomonadaceae bacterium]